MLSKGDDGESYFFHLSSLKDKSSKSKVTKNAYVLFDPSPTPKGNAAKNIMILDTFYRKRLVPFFVTKETNLQCTLMSLKNTFTQLPINASQQK